MQRHYVFRTKHILYLILVYNCQNLSGIVHIKMIHNILFKLLISRQLLVFSLFFVFLKNDFYY